MAKEKNETFNVYGGQVNMATGHSTMYVTQINKENSVEDLNAIIKGIKDSLSELKKENAEEITDAVDMVEEELAKSEPKASRLRNCITLISSIVTVVNGVPNLVENLQKLVAYIRKCIV